MGHNWVSGELITKPLLDNLAQIPDIGAAGTPTGDAIAAAIAAGGGGSGSASKLIPTATKTAAYTAAVGDLAVMNVAGGATSLTLPTAPADKAQVAFLAIGATTGTPLTVSRSGSDTIGTSATTSITVPLSGEVTVYQYQAASTRWLPVANVKPLAAIDGRYERLATYNVIAYGAKGDGATDDTPAFTAAANAASAAGGGVVFVPARPTAYIVQGLPVLDGVYYRGQGMTTSLLKLPASPTLDMFALPAAAAINSGGVCDLGLDGGGTPTGASAGGVPTSSNSARTGINLAQATITENFAVEHCWIKNFARGYYGSSNDRAVTFIATRIWQCATGVALNVNHPLFTLCDFRYNGTGLAGSAGGSVDLDFVNCKFNYNQTGADLTQNAGSVRNRFTSCTFFGNLNYGAKVVSQTTFVACMFYGYTGGTGVLLELQGGQNAVTGGCQFLGNWTTACINFKVQTGSPNWSSNAITGNVFYTDSAATGPVLRVDPTTSDVVRELVLAGNQFFLKVDVSVLFGSTAQTDLNHLTVVNNDVHYESATAATSTLFDNRNGTGGGGFNFSNNTIFGGNANAGPVLNWGSSIRSVIAGNRFRKVGGSAGTTVLTLGTTDADTRIENNFGYVTSNSGTATINASGTSVVVTHGLARTPKIQDIQVLAQANPGGYLWVSTITATQFTINISAAPASSLAVSWHADAIIG